MNMKNIAVKIIFGCFLICSCNNNSTTRTPLLVKDSLKIPVDSIKKSEVLVSQSPSCISVVIDILTTSKRYKEITNGLEERIIKNGGTSYGFIIEGSPNPARDSANDYSKTYDFSLHETYPDHNPVIARFSFDQAKHQLYEIDAASDSLVPIDFNKKLLQVLDKSCH